MGNLHLKMQAQGPGLPNVASSDGFELIEAEDEPFDAPPAVETDAPEPLDAQIEAPHDPLDDQSEATGEAEEMASDNVSPSQSPMRKERKRRTSVELKEALEIAEADGAEISVPEDGEKETASPTTEATPTNKNTTETHIELKLKANKNTTETEAASSAPKKTAPKSRAQLKPKQSLQVPLPQQAEAIVQKLPTKAQDYMRSVYATFTVSTEAPEAHLRLEIAFLVILQLWAASHAPWCAITAAVLVVFNGSSVALQARLDAVRSKVRPLLRAVPLVGLVPGAFGVILAFSWIPYLISAVLEWITDYLVWTVLAAYTGAEVGSLLLSKGASRSKLETDK